MFCGLEEEEERTKFRKKKKKKKKEMNLIAAKSGLVGMNGYLETYNPIAAFTRATFSCENRHFAFFLS